MQGRNVPPEKLEPFTFKDTGRTIQIRKVSTLIRSEVRRQVLREPEFTQPQPPMTEVDYGDGKQKVPHRGHPVYQQLMAEWGSRVTEEVGERLKRVAIKRGAVVPDEEIDQKAVAAVRADMADLGVDLSTYDDRYVYIAFVCVGPEAGWSDFLAAVFERSAPQEAAIQEHIATFPPDVRGEGSISPES